MISVCLATYNGEKFIKEQLDSILLQLGPEDEIIVSDDSSTDNTLNIIKSYKDERIKVYANQKYHSPIYNFENAIKKAIGQYIFLADQDDIWLPHKVEKMRPLLEQYDLVMSNAQVVNSSLNIIKEKFYSNNPIKPFLFNVIKNPYTGCLLAINRNMLKYILPFPKKLPMHDMWIGLCIQIFSKTYFLDENLVLYRRHGMNVSSASEKSSLPYLYRFKYRIYILFLLIRKVILYYLLR